MPIFAVKLRGLTGVRLGWLMMLYRLLMLMSIIILLDSFVNTLVSCFLIAKVMGTFIKMVF